MAPAREGGLSLRAFWVAAGLGAAIWALSFPLTGHAEPWDSPGPYYPVALLVAGAASGMLVPKKPWAHYLGAVLGQAAYEVAFLKMGALFVLGLAFLAAYSIIFFLAAAIAVSRRRLGKATEGGHP